MAEIRTGVPYAPEQMAEIYEHGAVVDLSKVNFPTCKTLEENMHALFVYLRNTGYKVTFDYTNMTYEQKVALLKEYLDTKIDYEIQELSTTWLSVLYACLGERIDGMVSILNDLELVTMQSAEFTYIEKIWKFLVSVPLFLIKMLDTETSEDEAEKTDEDFNLVNFYYILKQDEIDDLIVKAAGDIPPRDYVKIFTEDNKKLFECMQGCAFTTMLLGLVNSTSDEFKDFLTDVTNAGIDFSAEVDEVEKK